MLLRTVQSDGAVGGSKQQVGTSTQFPSWGGVLDFSQSGTFHGECYIIMMWERFVFWGHTSWLVRFVCVSFPPNLLLNICINTLWTFGHKVVLCTKKKKEKISNHQIVNIGLSVSSSWNKLTLSCMTATELQLFPFFFFSFSPPMF